MLPGFRQFGYLLEVLRLLSLNFGALTIDLASCSLEHALVVFHLLYERLIMRDTNLWGRL